MSLLRVILCAGVVAALLAAPSAEARFGKRSKPNASKQEVHEATPIGEEEDEEKEEEEEDDAPRKQKRRKALATSDDDTCCRQVGGPGEILAEIFFRALVEGLIYFIATNGTHLDGGEEELPPGAVSVRRHAAPLSLRMGFNGLPLRAEAGGLDFFLSVDGQRLGMEARLLRLFLPADDGTDGRDALSLSQLQLSWALYAVERARVRAEAGLSIAHAPDATFFGPGLGVSLEACVAGPLDVEARASLTPFPHRQVDGSAGLALHMAGFVVRGGWRGLYLDDAGGVDGVAHQDTVHGPYLGVGFAF